MVSGRRASPRRANEWLDCNPDGRAEKRRPPRTRVRRAELGTWKSYSSEKTSKNGGLELFREFIEENFVSCTVPAPCTDRNIAEAIAGKATLPIPIDLLSSELNENVHQRGVVIFGSPGRYFDGIASGYEGFRWWFSNKGLRMEVVSEEESVVASRTHAPSLSSGGEI
jgi:hypothetical protein